MWRENNGGVPLTNSTILMIIGALLGYISISLTLPLAFAIYYGEALQPFLIPLIGGMVLSLILVTHYQMRERIYPVDAILLVSVSWVMFSVFSAIPYLLSGYSIIDALFEGVSGVTTTGATILEDIEGNARSLLLWRNLSQWLGGAGIILLFVAIFPQLGVGGRELFKNEFTGPTKDFEMLRVREAARTYFLIYLLFSLVMFGFLLIRLSPYDALTLMFSTISTAGFSPYTDSVAHFGSAYVEGIVVLFMFASGTSFTLHYLAIHKRSSAYLKSSEFKVYVGILGVVSLITTMSLFLQGESITHAIRLATFTVVSLATTTGFTTTDYDQWAGTIKITLLLAMVIGGCAGSTSGGMKVVRAYLLTMFSYQNLVHVLHPKAYITVLFDGKSVHEKVMLSILSYLVLFLILSALSTIILSAVGMAPMDSLSATISCITNTGPGFGEVGPTHSYGPLPSGAKLMLVLDMLLGRLEFFVLLILLLPAFWHEWR